MIGFTDPFEHTWTSNDTPPPPSGRVRASKYRACYRYRDVYRMFSIWFGF